MREDGGLWRYGVKAMNAPVPIIVIPPTTSSPHFEDIVLGPDGPSPAYQDIEPRPPLLSEESTKRETHQVSAYGRERR